MSGYTIFIDETDKKSLANGKRQIALDVLIGAVIGVSDINNRINLVRNSVKINQSQPCPELNKLIDDVVDTLIANIEKCRNDNPFYSKEQPNG